MKKKRKVLILFLLGITMLIFGILPILLPPQLVNLRGTFRMGWLPSGGEEACMVYNRETGTWTPICYFDQGFGLLIDETTHKLELSYQVSMGKNGSYWLQVLLPFTVLKFDYQQDSGVWSFRQLQSEYGSVVTLAFNSTIFPGQNFDWHLFQGTFSIQQLASQLKGSFSMTIPFGNTLDVYLSQQLDLMDLPMNFPDTGMTRNDLSLRIPAESADIQKIPEDSIPSISRGATQLTWQLSKLATPVIVSYSVPTAALSGERWDFIFGVVFTTGASLSYNYRRNELTGLLLRCLRRLHRKIASSLPQAFWRRP